MKPSRWQPQRLLGRTWRNPGDWHPGWGEQDELAARYYRRLCAHYIGEARRWHRMAIEASDALYSSGHDVPTMDDGR
jgi:hypothetical protein